MTNLGGHCYETLLEAFAHAPKSNARTCFLAYTIKGYGLPLAGDELAATRALASQCDALVAVLGRCVAQETHLGQIVGAVAAHRHRGEVVVVRVGVLVRAVQPAALVELEPH